jgi:hypothetical protein
LYNSKAIQGPIYEVQPHEPKVPWERHGIPVEIVLDDERGTCTGAVHLDFPDEPLQFPCYALFLDPGNAFIIRGKELHAYQDEKGNDHLEKLVLKGIMTSEDINRNWRETPKGEVTIEVRAIGPVIISEDENRKLQQHLKGRSMVHKALNDAVRVGVGEFCEKIRYGRQKKKEDCCVGCSSPWRAEASGHSASWRRWLLGPNYKRGPESVGDPFFILETFTTYWILPFSTSIRCKIALLPLEAPSAL